MVSSSSTNNDPPPLITGLVIKAGKGDPGAFDKLADFFWGDIYRMVFFRTNSQMDAEDLAQETFLKAYRNLAKLKEPARFKPWLYSIALNLVKDHYRKKGLNSIFKPWDHNQDQQPEQTAQSQEGQSAEDGVFKKEFWAQVNRFSQGLPKGERDVFCLRFLDQLSIKEISQVLGKNQSAIKTQLYRAVAKFKDDTALLGVLRGES